MPSAFLKKRACFPSHTRQMEATLLRRIARAPPPTPIATGKGLRSAAVDNRVLTEYLESSLRVPDLNLPKPYPLKSPIPKTPTKINLSSLIAGEDASVGEMIRAVKEMGVFSIDAGGFLASEDVRASIEAGREAFQSEEEKEMVLEEEASDGAYRIFRDKTQKVASELQMVAESITKILSQQVGKQNHSANALKMHSVICLRKHGYSNQLSGDKIKHGNARTLSLHITGSNAKFCIHSPNSISYTLPPNSILVIVGKQFEKICNGELKTFNGEISLEPSDDQLAPFSLEFMYSLPVMNHMPNHSSAKAVSMMDQLLVLLILVFFYNLWS